MDDLCLFFAKRPSYASHIFGIGASATEITVEDIQGTKPAQPRDALRERRCGLRTLHELGVSLQPPQVGAQPVHSLEVEMGLLERAGEDNRMIVIESGAFLDRLHGVPFDRRQRRAWRTSVAPYAISPAPGRVNSQA